MNAMFHPSLSSLVLVGIVFGALLANPRPLLAGPPMIAEDDRDLFQTPDWMKALHPSNWKLPEWRSSPPKRREKGPMDAFRKRIGMTWQKTKETLDPRRLMPDSDRGVVKKNDSNSGWRSWFAPEPEPEPIRTATDFLRQPRTY